MIKNHITGFAMMRVQLGITQEQLAKRLQISLSLVKAMETGRRDVPEAAIPVMMEMAALVRDMPRQYMDQFPPKASAYPRQDLYNRVRHTKRGKAQPGRASVAMQLPLMSRFTATPTRIAEMTVIEIQQQLDQFIQQQRILNGQLQYLELEKQAAIVHAQTINALLQGSNMLIDTYKQAMANAATKKIAAQYGEKKLLEGLKKIPLNNQLSHFDEAAMAIRAEAIEALRNDIMMLDKNINAMKRMLLEVEEMGRLRGMKELREEAA